jgi:hypothetical protein
MRRTGARRPAQIKMASISPAACAARLPKRTVFNGLLPLEREQDLHPLDDRSMTPLNAAWQPRSRWKDRASQAMRLDRRAIRCGLPLQYC